MSDLEERVENIEKNIIEMNEKLDLIIKTINKDLTNDCKKMAKHIDFVEGVYENVKHPLNFICSKVTPLITNSEKASKTIENSRNFEIGIVESDDFDPEEFLHDSDSEV